MSSIKTQKDGLESFQLIDLWKGWESGAPREGAEALHQLPTELPMDSFHLAVPESHPFITNW